MPLAVKIILIAVLAILGIAGAIDLAQSALRGSKHARGSGSWGDLIAIRICIGIGMASIAGLLVALAIAIAAIPPPSS